MRGGKEVLRLGAQEAVLVGVLSGGMALVVLSFCGGILLDIVDSLYTCYAIDRCGRRWLTFKQIVSN